MARRGSLVASGTMLPASPLNSLLFCKCFCVVLTMAWDIRRSLCPHLGQSSARDSARWRGTQLQFPGGDLQKSGEPQSGPVTG